MLACVNLLMYGYFITFSDDYSRFGYVYSKFDVLDKFIKSKAKSNNLLGKQIWCLVSLFLSIGLWDYILVVCIGDSISKWNNRKKKSNFYGHGNIDDWFLITFHIHLGYSLEIVSYLHY